MEERNREITRHLQQEDVQRRILTKMQRGRSEATVTISNAARLFNFTENQLRDWDDKGLLKPRRPPQDSSQNGKSTKRRQYTPAELDKLAIIRELMDAGYSPGTIPANVDEIWSAVTDVNIQRLQPLMMAKNETERMPIDKRIELADEEVFWRYFVSQALRLSIMLICEDIPDTLAGLVLPLQKKNVSDIVHNPDDLPRLGYCLIGWLGRNRSFYTFLDSAPSFEFPSDFRVQPLAATGENKSQDETLIVVQRKARSLNLGTHLVETIRRLLEPIYDNVEKWRPCFDLGMRDWLYQVTDFTSSSDTADDVLNGLADIVVRLGGKTTDGQNRWRFACILSPKDLSLPLQQRSLVVRAQSKDSPHKVGVTTVAVSPDKHVDSFSLKAYQSGHIIYRAQTSSEDAMIAFRNQERPIRSVIAVPVAGEERLSAAVIYVVSAEANAFSEDDQRVLRIIGRMIEELLLTYSARQQGTVKLADLMSYPGIVDMSFREFLSENELLNGIEALLVNIQVKGIATQSPADVVVFIAVDIDDQSSLASKYGNNVVRNLSREVGLRIQGQLRALFTNPEDQQLYHVHADRFYLMLKGMPLDEARTKAELLRQVLGGDYRINALPLRNSMGRPMLPDSMLELSDITVRLAVTLYPYKKLEELLQRYPASTAVTEVRVLITRSLDEVLVLGQREGGNVVMSWEPESWGYLRWSPAKDS